LTAVVFQPDSLPEKVVNAREFGKALAPEGGGVIPPKTYTQQDGTVVTKAFKGWSRQPDGSELVAWVSDLGRDAEAIAGKTFELYAIYE
jgi:hypothetical protein